MVPGFNHNVSRHGKPYHVQTEDLGISNPSIVTHLFTGGAVVATARTSYADLLGARDLPGRVRELMVMQHKQVLRDLVNGAYDALPAVAARAEPSVPGRPSDAPPARGEPSVLARGRIHGAEPEREDSEPDASLDQVILAYLAGEPEGRE